MSPTERINDQARGHEESLQDWGYGEVSRHFYRWYDEINACFFGSKVPTPVLSFKRKRGRTRAWYVDGRNETGVLENIAFNVAYLGEPLADLRQQLDPRHPGHPLIGHHYVEVSDLVDDLQRLWT